MGQNEKKNSNFGKFMILWFGEIISGIGGGLTSFGLGVYVFNMTGSAGWMALITLVGFLPTLLLSVPAGALADKYDRRILMMIGDGLSAIGIILILISMLLEQCSYTIIVLGVLISAVFSSLLEPAYRATVTDLLTKEEYTKASGLISLAGSARYLLSPIIAGLLLAVCDVSILLIIDISTFALTVITTFVVKKGIITKSREHEEGLIESIVQGYKELRNNKGVFSLVLIAAVITFFIGVFQILAEPMILSFADSKTLGITETICASGMLVSGVILGIKGIKNNYVKTLCASLFVAGIFITLFGVYENVILMCIFGFGFFLMLPFANSTLDYLVRTNIKDELQGRVWGFVGFISQLGYVFSYSLSGILADMIAKYNKLTIGRGAGCVVTVSGLALMLVAFIPVFVKNVRNLEVDKEL